MLTDLAIALPWTTLWTSSSRTPRRENPIGTRAAGALLATFVAIAPLTEHRALAAGPFAIFPQIDHQRIIPYPFDQVWPTAIRYLRVDRGYAISDRDEAAGYILFEFPMGHDADGTARTGRGSLEMFRTADASGRPSVSMRVTTSDGPTHLAHAIVEGVAGKLRTERGQPSAPPPPPAQPTKPKDTTPPAGHSPDQADPGMKP